MSSLFIRNADTVVGRGQVWRSCTGVPNAITTANYNAANQQLTLGPQSATYDHNGNLQTLTDSSGITTYWWNVSSSV
jgi:hypothetical protein